MKKKKSRLIMLGIFILILGVVSWFLFLQPERIFDPKRILENSILEYLEENHEEEYIILPLSYFTDFDWDYGIIFAPPTTERDISNILNVKYTRNLDINFGIVFAKDGVVVYDEIFRVYIGFRERPLTDRFRISVSEFGGGVPFYVFDRNTKFKFTRIVWETDNGYRIDYHGFPISTLHEADL